MEYLFRCVFYNIYKDRKKLLAADLETTQRSNYAKTNILNRKDIQKRFDHDLKEEICELDSATNPIVSMIIAMKSSSE